MNILGILMLIIIAAASRFLPHPANFTMLGSAALFAPAFAGKRGFAVGAAALFLSDAFIGFYDLRVMAAVYASVLLAGFIGKWISENISAARVLSGAFVSASLFYVITNFAVWKFSGMYAPDFSGLVASYAAALPFFRNALAADLLFSSALFFAYEHVRRRAPESPPAVKISL